MTRAYYSTVFEQPAAVVWAAIRDVNNYSVRVSGEGISEIEDGKSGDTVGAVRNVLVRERRIRQRLLALSDVERSQTYEFCGPPSLRAVLGGGPDAAQVEHWRPSAHGSGPIRRLWP